MAITKVKEGLIWLGGLLAAALITVITREFVGGVGPIHPVAEPVERERQVQRQAQARAATARERAAKGPQTFVRASPSTNRLVTIAPVAEAPTTGGVFLLTERGCVDQTGTLAAFADTSKIVTAWGCAHHDGVQVSITWVHGNPNYFASPTSTVTPGSWQRPSAVYTAAAP